MSSKIKILLADDHRIVREGLISLIDEEDDLMVVGESENGLDTIAKAEELKPDVIILDVAMPEMDGIEACRKILVHHPRVKVIALSVHTDWRYVTSMLDAGAAGYLCKECAFDELVKAIRLAMKGEIYVSPKITGKFANLPPKPPSDPSS